MICITGHVQIKGNRIVKDGKIVFENPEDSTLRSFLKAAYKSAGIKYPKFYKMDGMSKLGFIAAEYLLDTEDFKGIDSEDTGIILSNAHATLVTDKQHQQSIDTGEKIASPAIFVYTLPNIVTGEISIRHNLKGENAFFVTKEFQPEMMVRVINNLFLTRKMKAALAGWIDESEEGWHAFLYKVVQTDQTKDLAEHTPEKVKNIFETKI